MKNLKKKPLIKNMSGINELNCATDNVILTYLKNLSIKKCKDVKDAILFYEINKNYDVKDIILNTKVYCGKYAIVKTCADGHRIAKKCYCQSEFCEICSVNLSQAHKRRISRLMKYVFSFDTLGYFVFTLPIELREIFLSDKKYKNKIQRFLKNITKKYFGNKAIGRWHWFGDKSNKFNPHCNLLVDSKYINDKVLNNVKNQYKNFIKKLFCLKEIKKISVNYSYYKDYKKYFHKIKYITRSTIRKDIDDVILIKLYFYLYKTKNTFVIGAKNFDFEKSERRINEFSKNIKYDEKEIDELILNYHIQKKYSSNICPCCGKNFLDYLKEFRVIYDTEIYIQYSNGYIRLKDEDFEILEQRIQKEKEKMEKYNKIQEMFFLDRYEKLLFGNNYLDFLAITDKIKCDDKKFEQIKLDFM